MQKLFGTDGIRGTIGKNIDIFMIVKIAMAGGISFRKNSITNKILVGKDTRKSGYMVENAIVSGLTAIGFDVIQIGPMPTPTVGFLTVNMRCDGGIMISASHNPYQDNGIKFFNSKGQKLSFEQESDIESIFHNEKLLIESYASGKHIGSSKRIDDVIGRYIVHIKNSFPGHLTLNGIRVVIDTANGAGYKVAPQIFEELGAEVFIIHNKPNGTNINKNCGALHHEDLANEVQKVRANVGIALDGDADRLVVVDENGSKVDGDNLMASIAVYLKSINKLKNNTMISTIMSNNALKEYLISKDIKYFSSDVGDRFVTQLMKEKDVNFGGEESGHIIFSDYSSSGDGLLSALQTMAILVSSDEVTSKALRKFVPFNRNTYNLPIQNKIPLEDIKELENIKNDLKSKNLYYLIRYSGTENLLRILIEGDKTSSELDDEMHHLVEFFKKTLA
ncbi:Phosphoglucosamine mutase [hydrothermal vent metagenome]|uniref:Phosphoglucosamine mutase n=1 Tax=hydrothermal vent metagenome TaxID=652676 RepID=A0A3B1E916_9ZZZZ